MKSGFHVLDPQLKRTKRNNRDVAARVLLKLYYLGSSDKVVAKNSRSGERKTATSTPFNSLFLPLNCYSGEDNILAVMSAILAIVYRSLKNDQLLPSGAS